ncbi:hypothetical protein [Roseospira navarrensis]|uniref:Uncharacterized protein n=1 Tax=Roseospira navarrensis TaxID=140058 RepID=A0A7X2D2J3_9PROT|nr:hypothetical protein [Roseospira navarrensis]MQX35766.1 hypothetical protein [Roseospira navarrensis]
MRAVKILVATMGVLIIAGMGLVIYGLMKSSEEMAKDGAVPEVAPAGLARPVPAPVPAPASPFDPVHLGEPAGSRIAHMTSDGHGRLLLGLTDGGRPDRVVVIDTASGRTLGVIGLEAAPTRSIQ